MIILVDAYNLLKTVLHVTFISDKQREHFLQLFKRYTQHRPAHKVLLVFDGGYNLREEEEQFDSSIVIVYAGSLQTADDVLKKKMYALRSNDLLLVTCDRQIRRYAAQYGIESLGSVEFYHRMQEVLHEGERQQAVIAQTICKTAHDDTPELDRLMELASRTLVTKDQDKAIKVVMKTDKKLGHSKKDKKLLKKIAKI